jgi:hypothetical protein
MNLLTDQEIYTAYIEAANQTLRPQDERIALAFARAIESAVIKALAQSVSVEPDYQRLVYKATGGDRTPDPEDYRDYYTLETLQAAIATARVQENERCANSLTKLITMAPTESEAIAIALAQGTIRALLGKEAT